MRIPNKDLQIERLYTFQKSRVEPSMKMWREVMNEGSISQIHSGQTLLELLSLLLLGIEIGYFPDDESTLLIQSIFDALGENYHLYMSSFAENWLGDERSRFSFAFHQRARGYHESFREVIIQPLEPVFATAILLLENFSNDEAAFIYQASQNNMKREQWAALSIRSTTYRWATEFDGKSANVPRTPFWIPGFLNSYGHMEGQLSLFVDVSGSDMLELKHRVLGLQRWRFNISNSDTKSRFFEVSDSIAEILDLITPAGLQQMPKEQFKSQVATVAQEFGGGLTLVAGA